MPSSHRCREHEATAWEHPQGAENGKSLISIPRQLEMLHCFCLAVKLAFQRNCQTVQSLLMKKVSRYRRCSWTGLFQTGDQVWPVILCVKLVCDSFPPCVDRWVSLPADRAGFFIFLSTGKRGYQRTGNPFIKRFRHVQTVQPLYGGGCPPPGLAT
jgi:hypothetical protein